MWTQQPAMRQLPSDLGRPRASHTGLGELTAATGESGSPGRPPRFHEGRAREGVGKGAGGGEQRKPRCRSAGSSHFPTSQVSRRLPASSVRSAGCSRSRNSPPGFLSGGPHAPNTEGARLEAPRGPGLSLWPTRLLSPGPVPSSCLKAPVSTIVSFPPKLIHFLTHSRYLNVPTCNTSGQISRAGPPCDKATRGDPGALTATAAPRSSRPSPPREGGPCSPPSPRRTWRPRPPAAPPARRPSLW